MSNPSVQPTPVAGPTPTVPYQLPNIPSNAYTLLSNFATAIDTANTKLTGHASKVSDINTSTNNAVSHVVSTSKGQATDALDILWTDSKTDLSHAHDQLSAVTTSSQGIGPGPGDFQSTFDQNKALIQTGLTALDNLRQHQNGNGVVNIDPSNAQMMQWKQDVDALDSALANINMALDVMAMAIRGLNSGFRAACATGLTRGAPPPLFNKNAFAHQSADGGGGGNKGNDNGPKSTTPEGRPLSGHSQSSLPRHGMTPEQVDNVIDNYSRKTTQSDGATVYIMKQPGRGRSYSIVIESTDGTIITAMRNLDPLELSNLGKNHGFNPNP